MDKEQFPEFEFLITVRVKQRGVDMSDAMDRAEMNLNLRRGRTYFESRQPNHTDETTFTSTITDDSECLMGKAI